VWFRVSCAQTIDLIDATAADCTLPDQHDAHVNAAPRSLQRRPDGHRNSYVS
jgi:hypothetical protein